jgi:antitoxin CptB
MSTVTLSEKDRARLRWRARRGLLENDLIVTRFLDRYESSLTDQDVAVLHQLFDLTDNDLLDYLLDRRNPEGELASAEVMTMLARLRQA